VPDALIGLFKSSLKYACSMSRIVISYRSFQSTIQNLISVFANTILSCPIFLECINLWSSKCKLTATLCVNSTLERSLSHTIIIIFPKVCGPVSNIIRRFRYDRPIICLY
jgi:hypothetical protein